MLLAESLDFGLIRPQDPAAGWRVLTASGHPTAMQPVVERDVGHLDGERQRAQPPLVGAEGGLRRPMGARRHDPEALEQIQDPLGAEALAAFGRAVALGI